MNFPPWYNMNPDPPVPTMICGDASVKCINTDGSYECSCVEPGMMYDPAARTCVCECTPQRRHSAALFVMPANLASFCSLCMHACNVFVLLCMRRSGPHGQSREAVNA